MVLWDKQHKNLIYISPDRRYQVIVDAPGKLKKTKEKLDAVINAYKVNFEHDVKKAIAGGNYLVIQGSE